MHLLLQLTPETTNFTINALFLEEHTVGEFRQPDWRMVASSSLSIPAADLSGTIQFHPDVAVSPLEL